MVFEEKQTMLRWWWILALLPVILILVIGVIVPENEVTEENKVVSAITTLVVVEAFVILLFALMRLTSRIDDKGVSFGYSPFIKKRIHLWRDIENVWVRKYSPLGEYGGWGIKTISPKKHGIAYNVWGNKGLQIHLKNGKKILIGTQKPDEMVAFLKRLKEKHELVQIDEPQLNG